MGKHLVLVGGGHAHLTTILHLAGTTGGGYRVTVISPEPCHYYSGMGPGMLSGMYSPQQVRFNIGRMVESRGGTFLEDRVARVIPEKRVLILSRGGDVSYDVASFNTGSEVPMEIFGEFSNRIIPVKPLFNLYRARCSVLEAPADRHLKISVVGGGPAGAEIAANAWRLLDRNRRFGQVTLIAGRRLLKDHPSRVRDLAAANLQSKGIRLLEDVHVTSLTPDAAHLSDGRALPHDFVLVATGVRPHRLFRDSGMLTDASGGLMVNEHLQAVHFPEIFGGGDCIGRPGEPLPRVGVYAVRQNPVLKHNLDVMLNGGRLKVFSPGGAYLLIMNMGDGTGIAWKKGSVWSGRLAFLLKDFIDKRFMRKYQVSGELGEPL